MMAEKEVVNRAKLNRSTLDRFDIPVVLFIFRRLDTVKMIMEQITQIKPKTFYVFADAARAGAEGETQKVQTVRDYISTSITWECDAKLYFRERNYGCANNIIDGMSTVFAIEPYAIILEDDVVPRQDFFYYCQYLLKKYADEEVQFIAGFNGVGEQKIFDTSYAFSNSAPMSGAIATWAKRWNGCDFSMSDWPEVKKTKAFQKAFYYREYYKNCMKALEDSYKNVNDGWDYQFHYDLLARGRLAIVPKGNLVKNHVCVEGAFHPLNKRQAKNMQPLLDYSDFTFEEPIMEPKQFQACEDYDRMRQKLFLEVNGTYLQRHLYYAKRGVKDFLYRFLPKWIWNIGKQILRKGTK